MPSYAVLGATGNTGSDITRLLLSSSPNNTVHAFVRNAAKLHDLVPETQHSRRVRIFEASSLTDAPLMAEVLRGTRAVFLVLSTNDNIPGYHVGQDVARTVIAACRLLLQEGGSGEKVQKVVLPRVVLLSSASNAPALDVQNAWLLRAVIHRAAYHVYADLKVAEELLRAERGWLTSVYVTPGGLSKGGRTGHALSLARSSQDWCSYVDLAAAMVEAGDDADGRYDGRYVGVLTPGGGAEFPSGTPMALVRGLLRYYFPWLHTYLATGGHG